mmetsp:Transcript_1381/g.1843  ORF Transcript_1381/g.1843 Transcript_1381/m.1843 type:complete len:202 (-) Transcript_1381:168-773(-)
MNVQRLLNLWFSIYNRLLDRRPVATSMVTSGLLWFTGDLFAQQIDLAGKEEENKLDWGRTAVNTIYASAIWAPLGHYWYAYLDHVTRRTLANRFPPTSPRFVFMKMALEIVALHPLSLLSFFGCTGVMNGKNGKEVMEQLRNDFLPTLALEVAMWTPLDIYNFRFVPVRHQLLVVNCGAFIESVGLSWIQNNGIDLESLSG